MLSQRIIEQTLFIPYLASYLASIAKDKLLLIAFFKSKSIKFVHGVNFFKYF